MTDFKPLVKIIRNNNILLITIIKIKFNKLKAYIIIAIKFTSKFNMFLIIL